VRRVVHQATQVKSTQDSNDSNSKNVHDVVGRRTSCPAVPTTTAAAADAAPPLLLQTTLTTQLSIDRFWLLTETCVRWKDPLVAVVYLGRLSLSETNSVSDLAASLSQRLSGCAQSVHLVLYVDDEYNDEYDDEDRHGGGKAATDYSPLNHSQRVLRRPYPINLLRNVALQAVQTAFVLMVDVDFVPSVTLADEIRAAWQMRTAARLAWAEGTTSSNSNSSSSNQQPMLAREALVVPALELNFQEAQPAFFENPAPFLSLIPRTWDQLALCIRTGFCATFHENFQRAHGSTRTALWLQQEWYHNYTCHRHGSRMTATTVQDLRRVECVDAPGYEPYLVLPWCAVARAASAAGSSSSETIIMTTTTPYYDERLEGYGWNKIAYIQHLRYLGFQLWVLPRGFVVHLPHRPTVDQVGFTEGEDRLARRVLYDEVLAGLSQRYGWSRSNLRSCTSWWKQLTALNQTPDAVYCDMMMQQ
jgi:hypothetical protein